MMRLFLIVVALFVALQSVAQVAPYRVQIGDQLRITVIEDNSLNSSVLVRPDGQISLPIAGTVRAEGQTTTALERVIANRLSASFEITPNVSVAVTQVGLGGDPFLTGELTDIYVLGEVGNPGRIDVESGTTILEALAIAGGPGDFAATKRIQIRRYDPSTGAENIILFNYHALQRGAQLNSNFRVRSGDVILVPERRLFE